MDAVDTLTADQRDAVLALVEAAAASDGVRPLNDEALLDLGRPGARHWLSAEPSSVGQRLIGYAQLDPAFGTAQLVVHPDHRRLGHGRSLLDAAAAAGATGYWAFGDLPAAQALAGASGLQAGRALLIMERPLGPELATARPREMAGVTLRTFLDADTDAFLAVNAAAFEHHPEQGSMSRADFEAKQAEPWWDPAGLIIATDDEGVVGFHWTKRHNEATGEVYVIGVAPRAFGRGIGTILLDAGLAHLAAIGCTRVILYVESDNPAVHLYERTGFRTAHRDALYSR